MTKLRWPGRPGEAAERRRRTALVLLTAALFATAACNGGGGEDAGPTTTSIPLETSATGETTTSTAPLTRGDIVLAADGVGPLKFGNNAANTIRRLIDALGEPEKNTPLPAAQACGATRRLTWANFQVLTNEVGGMSGAGRPGFAGWWLGPPTGNALDFKTEKGIGVGSTAGAIKAAYGADATFSRGEQGPAFTITLPTGIIIGQLDAQGDAGKVKNIQAGNYCGPA